MNGGGEEKCRGGGREIEDWREQGEGGHVQSITTDLFSCSFPQGPVHFYSFHTPPENSAELLPIVPKPESAALFRNVSLWAIIYTFSHARMSSRTSLGLYLSPFLCHPVHAPAHIPWLHTFPWGERTVSVYSAFPSSSSLKMWDLILVHENLQQVPSCGHLSPLAWAVLYLCSKKVPVHLIAPSEQWEELMSFHTGKQAFIPITKPVSLRVLHSREIWAVWVFSFWATEQLC